ncbi:MAG: GNAT family N-acetyltransferase [Myxococcota bacterium]
MSIAIRAAQVDDAVLIHAFIQELADYEKEPDAVEVTPNVLRQQLQAAPKPFEAWMVTLDGEVVGFALTFTTYSTWRGRPGLWLEDFYVRPSARGNGAGSALFRHLGALCRERGYGRLELAALDWNTLATDFYQKRGATPMKDWTTWRFDGAALEAL